MAIGTVNDVRWDPYDINISRHPYPDFRRLRKETRFSFSRPCCVGTTTWSAAAGCALDARLIDGRECRHQLIPDPLSRRRQRLRYLHRSTISTASANEYGKGFPTADGGGRSHPDVVVVDFPVWEPVQYLLQRNATLHPGKRRTEAEVDTEAEG